MTQARDLADNKFTGDVEIDTDTLVVDSANNRVGIGTSSPSANLDVASSNATIHLTDTDDTTYAEIRNNGGTFTIASDEGQSATNSSINFRVDGSERMRIDNDGVLLVGTTSQNNDLNKAIFSRGTASAAGGVENLYWQSGTTMILDGGPAGTANSAAGINFFVYNGSFANNAYIQGIATSTAAGGPASLSFGRRTGVSTYAESMRITSAGNLAVGATGDSGKLFVNQTSASAVATYCYANNAAYTNVSHRNTCVRTGSSGYYFYFAESGNGSDTEFYVRGDGLVRADGTIAGGGADYAEMFEWDDGNPSNEDRRGFSVALTNGNKIRKATSSDAASDIIGIASGTAMLIGDAEPMKWSGKYNTDNFGSYIWESYTLTKWTEPAVVNNDGEVIQEAVEHSYETDKIPSDLTVPNDAVVSSVDADGNTLKRRQLNPNYDDTQTYTPREERQEWDAVGMMGKLRMRSGQPTGDRWIKMRDIATDDNSNVTVEEWLVR